jgi:hypothetical protein
LNEKAMSFQVEVWPLEAGGLPDPQATERHGKSTP